MKESIKTEARDTLGKAPKRNTKEWFSEECLIAVEEREKVHKAYLERPTRTKNQEIGNWNREMRNICRRKNLNDKMAKIVEEFKEDPPYRA